MDRTITSDASVSRALFVESGKTLVGVCADNKLRFWDTESGALRQTVGNEPLGQPYAFIGSGVQFAGVSKDGKVQLRDMKTASIVRELPPIMPRAGDIAFSDDGSRVATAHIIDRQTGVNTIRVRDASGKDLFTVPAGIGGISTLGFSPDGSTLVASSYDADLRVWSVRNGELIKLVEELPVSMFDLSFSPDGKWLAMAGVDRIVYLWNTKTWKLDRKITGQPEMISALTFSPDGKRIVTGGMSELTVQNPVKLIVWDVESARQLKVMPAPHRVTGIAFSQDGSKFASTYGQKTVHIWQAP